MFCSICNQEWRDVHPKTDSKNADQQQRCHLKNRGGRYAIDIPNFNFVDEYFTKVKNKFSTIFA